MDIFFQDPSDVPLPPEEVRIRALRADPLPDGRRVRVYLEVDPSQKRPSAEVQIINAEGQELSRANIVELMSRKMELVMHFRQPTPDGQYALRGYSSLPHPCPSRPARMLSRLRFELPEPLVVDKAETRFTLSAPSQ